ncbi:glycosyl transferase family 2 [Haladaptatus paucihalophilus DX253]|uniref:Glycosyl transferase family 2 n=1 Tax=Haladaptatus paucihalophilus DX253 TaxID=797209 RepID=E7QW50_HALPU|nr:glycosyltransferase family 2 protein [Haladaptatus paucihalophilus]EFW91184.1 glycosyl transferase family 2 [Haladaptatus paucihalophilus DX253]SHL64613.1 Glycosyltransferase involved in cell wall bisynthesis [Haladaptatus paucihalophilus DX253]
MYEGHTIGVVVPAYNEEGFVGDVLDSLPDFVDRVYVVDDASTDGTWDEIRAHAAIERAPRAGESDDTDGQVVAIQHEVNRGAGAAIKTGYLAAREDQTDITVTIDADGQMDPGMMTRFLDPIVAGDADYAKGNRLSNPEFRHEMPRFRLLGNWMLTWLTRIASGYWDVTDPQNGYTAISLPALEAIDLEGMYEYYGYCNDILVKLNVAGMRVADVDMPATYGDEESSIEYNDYIPKVSLMLLRNFLWRLGSRYRTHPLGIAYLVGIVSGVVGIALGVRAAGATLTGSESDDGRKSLTSLVVGVVGIIVGVVLDRRENT